MTVRKLAAGNWKMNGSLTALTEVEALAAAYPEPTCDIVLCPPATLIRDIVQRAGSRIGVGGQDCHARASGAHTGDIAASMLADAGAVAVILGHSERRTDHGETNELVRAKAEAAHAAGLTAIICVGETKAERNEGQALSVIGAQLAASVPDMADESNTVVAYEPVWAIGTGRTPTLDQIAEVHGFVRRELTVRFGKAAAGIRLLYGGSVKPSNASEIFSVADVDGALVGGASLTAGDFGAIIEALQT